MTICRMDGVGVVAVVALSAICVAQEWALIRLVSRLLPPVAPQSRLSAPRASQPRTGPSDYTGTHAFRHPSQNDWPNQGDLDDRA